MPMKMMIGIEIMVTMTKENYTDVISTVDMGVGYP